MPGIAWGPGVGVRADHVSHALVSSMDIFPTVADYADIPLPDHRRLDGQSIRGVLTGAEDDAATAGSRVLYHYCGFVLHAMRYGPYKAYFHTPRYTDPATSTCNHGPGDDIHLCGCIAGLTTEHWPPLMYDVDADPSERTPMDPLAHAMYAPVLAVILRERARHEQTLEAVRSHIATPAIDFLQPCCNPPECRCSEAVLNAGTPQ